MAADGDTTDTTDVSEDMTIEELSRRARVATTTVRMYQSRRLLPGPRREGRIGRYGAGHLARLRLIDQLQARGFSLAAVKQVVDAWEAGRSLDDLLGFERRLPGAAEVAAPGEQQVVTLQDLASRFPAGALTPEVMDHARRLGLVEPTHQGDLAVSPTFLEVGTELAGMGIPVDALLAEQEALQRQTDAVADRFVALFRTHLWDRYVEADMTDRQVARAAAAVERLSELALRVADESLRASLRRAAADVVADEARRVAGPDAADRRSSSAASRR